MPILPRTGFRRCRRSGQRSCYAALRVFRDLAVEEFVTGALESALQPGEIVEAVRVPVMTPSARWGYVKACRKQGEFAHAIAAVVIDPASATARAVIGALNAAPIVLGDAAALFGGRVTGDFQAAIRCARCRCNPDQGRHSEPG